MKHKIVALIPARAGSKRVVDKNIRILGGHPVLAYTIRAAIDSGIFTDVVVSTDSQTYADIALHYGAQVPELRPHVIAGAKSPDIEFVHHMLHRLQADGAHYDFFSILRPTSPFRQPSTIARAWANFREELDAGQGVDSLRAVELCKQHPGKMWVVRGQRMHALLPLSPAEQPWHSTQYAALPEVYVQNASLEIARTAVALQDHTIAGEVIMPFFTEGHEGWDINDPQDWWITENMVQSGEAQLPRIDLPAYG